MKVKTEITVEFEGEDVGASPVKFEAHDGERIALLQGTDIILLPRDQVSEFCHLLIEWAAKE